MERVPPKVVNPGRSVGSSCGTDVNVCCEDKLRSLSEGEVKTLVGMSEESIAKILAGPIVDERIVDESRRNDVVGDLDEGGQKYLSSTPVKSASGVENVADSWKLPSELSLKCSAGVTLMISKEDDELACELAQCGKRNRKSSDADGN